MRNLFLSLSLLICSLSFGQMAVYDAGTNAQMGEQIATTSKQLTQLESTYKILKDAQDKYTQVNGYLRNINDLREITTMYKEVITGIAQIRQEIPRIKNRSTQKMMVNRLKSMITSLGNSIETVNMVMSGDFFKMDDSQRMGIINRERRKILIQKSQLASMR